jgi:hypothetical protein
MMARGVPLYFPDGIPKGVQRLVDPDVIHREVVQGLKSLEKPWSSLAQQADQISHGVRPWWKRIFGTTSLSREWLHHYLYTEKEWPSLSKEEKAYLRLLRRVRQMGSDHQVYLTPEEAPPRRAEIQEALEMMARDTKMLMAKMTNQYNSMLDRTGKKIEPLCEGVYGEPCEPGEGAEIVNGDIFDLLKMRRFPTSSTMSNVLVEFLPAYDAGF